MRFYIVETPRAGAVACELTVRAAHAQAASLGYATDEYAITMMAATVSAETIRRLLGNIGGFAHECKQVHG